MATPPRPLGRPARFFFMHLGTLVSIIVYFVLLPQGLARALWTALAVHTAYMLLAHWQGERKQFDIGLWLYFAVGALASAAGVAPLVALYQHYSPALLFVDVRAGRRDPARPRPRAVHRVVRRPPDAALAARHARFHDASAAPWPASGQSCSSPPRRCARRDRPIRCSPPSTRTCWFSWWASRPDDGSRRSGCGSSRPPLPDTRGAAHHGDADGVRPLPRPATRAR